jgi:hypothetical protein
MQSGVFLRIFKSPQSTVKETLIFGRRRDYGGRDSPETWTSPVLADSRNIFFYGLKINFTYDIVQQTSFLKEIMTP